MINSFISIIVPIYNAEKYLPKLIDCLQNQTYKNFEVILVDDFSTDNSSEILKKTEDIDNRFRLITRDKKGGTAVSGIVYGLPFCKGEYYFYLSQDDFIDYDCLEKCMSKAVKTNADVVLPNMVYYYENKKSKKKGKYPIFGFYNQILTNKKAFQLSLKWRIPGTALRKMSLMKSLNINDKYYNNDEFFNRKFYLYANKIAFANTNFYYRQDNQDAITKKIHYFTFDVLTTDILLANLLIEHDFSKNVINKRFRELIEMYSDWANLYKLHSEEFTDEQKDYVLNALINAKNELEKTAKERHISFKLLEEVK